MESEYINELKVEHELILNILREIMNRGVTTNEGKEALRKFKDLFFEHKKNEEKHLMPALERAAQSTSIIQPAIVADYKKQHVELEEYIEMFFENLENESIDEKTTIEEFGKIMAEFSLHMYKEERILYKQYDKLPENLK